MKNITEILLFNKENLQWFLSRVKIQNRIRITEKSTALNKIKTASSKKTFKFGDG